MYKSKYPKLFNLHRKVYERKNDFHSYYREHQVETRYTSLPRRDR